MTLTAAFFVGACKTQTASANRLESRANAAPAAAASQAASLDVLVAKARKPNSGVKFIPVPILRQSLDFTCGTTSMQSVLYYYGDEFREASCRKS